jgi:hypothetical protein
MERCLHERPILAQLALHPIVQLSGQAEVEPMLALQNRLLESALKPGGFMPHTPRTRANTALFGIVPRTPPRMGGVMREISKRMIRTVTISFPRVSVVAAQTGRLPRSSFARSSAGS